MLDRGKSETVHALTCGEVWPMSQMASGRADTGLHGNSGKVCCLDVDYGEPLACKAPRKRLESQLIDSELEKDEMGRLG